MKLALVLSSILLFGSVACSGPQRVPPPEVWPDMKRDGKFKPQEETDIFSDHRKSRRPASGTVARGHLQEDASLTSGITADGKMYVGLNPLKVNAETMKVGQAKYNTYCAPCHSRVGNGRGIVALKTPSWQPANLHDDRIKQQADGELYHTISYGKNSMPGYRFQMVQSDRWAIVAYVRAIQRTSSGTLADVPVDLQAGLR